MIAMYLDLAGRMRERASGWDRGASLVEYALLVALIAVVCVLAVQLLGQSTSTSISTTASHVANAN